MTIKKGEPWGAPFVVPVETRDVAGDHDLAAGTKSDIHIVQSGDIFDALGQPNAPIVGQTRTLIHIDALQCTITTQSGHHELLAASSVTIGRWRTTPWSTRRFVCVTNGGLYKNKNVAPRAHPNDGMLDIVEVSAAMPWRQRAQSYQRARTGDHLPHPLISVSRGTECEFSLEHSRENLCVDFQPIENWQSIRVKIIPDYWQVIV